MGKRGLFAVLLLCGLFAAIAATQTSAIYGPITTPALTIGSGPTITASAGGTTQFLRADGQWVVPAGGGGSYSAQSWSDGVPASSYPAGVTANQLSLVAIEIPTAVQAAKIGYWINAGDSVTSDLYSIGIYNSSGALIAHTAPSDWQYGSSSRFDSLVEGQVSFAAGIYFLGLTGNTASASLYSVCGAQKNYALYANSSYAATSGGVPPASITPPTLASSQGCAPYIFLGKQ